MVIDEVGWYGWDSRLDGLASLVTDAQPQGMAPFVTTSKEHNTQSNLMIDFHLLTDLTESGGQWKLRNRQTNLS